MKTRILCGLVAACGCLSPGLGAQDPDSIAVDTVRYILEPIEVAVERERSAPPPVGALTVSPVDLRRAQSADAYQLLRDVAGVEVHAQGQGPGYASNVVMRGFTSDHSSDVLLVIDGVPVNLPAHGHVEGYADWNVLMSSSVASMRVIEGNASPLYGDFALAGTVEVFTRADAEGARGSFSASSFRDLRGDVSTGRRFDDGGFFVGAQGARDEGWREGSDAWLANGLVRGWRSLGRGRLEGGVGVYGSGWDSPGFVSVTDFNAELFQTPTDPTDGGRSRRVVGHARYAQPGVAGGYLQAVGWGMHSDYSFFLHIPGHDHGGAGLLQQSGEWDERVGGGGQVELGWTTSRGDVLLGVSGRADDVRYEHALTLLREVVDPEIELDSQHRAGAAYGRWRLTAGDRLGVDVGLRADVVRHRSRSTLSDEPTWISSTNTIVSPKLGARFELARSWYAVATTARGFRSAVGIIGDPTREPYISWSNELAIEREGDDWEASLSAFRVDVDNERVFDAITLASSGAGESTRQGLEGRLAVTVTERLAVEVGGTWNHARLSAPYADAHEDHPNEVFAGSTPVEVSTDEDARRVPGLADHHGRVRLLAQATDDVEARLSWRWSGPHVPIGEPSVRTRAYSVLDAGVSWTIADGRTIDLELGNALDIRYVELRSTSYVTPGAPRSLRVRMTFDTLPF